MRGTPRDAVSRGRTIRYPDDRALPARRSRSGPGGIARSRATLLRLQATAGNVAVAQLLSREARAPVQPVQRTLAYADDWTASMLLVFSRWVDDRAKQVWTRIQPVFDDTLAPALRRLRALQEAGFLDRYAERAQALLSWLDYARKIPYAKGKELDRSLDDLLASARALERQPLSDIQASLQESSQAFFVRHTNWQQVGLPGFDATHKEWTGLKKEMARRIDGKDPSGAEDVTALWMQARKLGEAFALAATRIEALTQSGGKEEQLPDVPDPESGAKPPSTVPPDISAVVPPPKIVTGNANGNVPTSGPSTAPLPPVRKERVAFTAEEAHRIVGKVPPERLEGWGAYLVRVKPELKVAGFKGISAEHRVWLQEAFRKAGEALSNLATERPFRYDDSSTWTINPIVYVGLSRDEVLGADAIGGPPSSGTSRTDPRAATPRRGAGSGLSQRR